MKRNIGRTFVLLNPEHQRVEGYYTLCSCSLSRDSVGDNKKLNYAELPAILIGRLAVDSRLQGQGYGELLLYHALRAAARQSQVVAAHSVVVDAMHERAERFYNRYDFAVVVGTPAEEYPKCLYLEMSMVLAADYAQADAQNR